MVTRLREMESLLARAVGQLGPPEVGATVGDELRQELRALIDQIGERIAPLEGRLATVEVALSSVDTLRKELNELIGRATVTSRLASAKADSLGNRLGSVEMGLAAIDELRQQFEGAVDDAAARARASAVHLHGVEGE
ncbi:MAG: hypothetical protein KY431_10045, partial [Actinobacteria bacterium]|nr:hypothetical protein [Actinomycetota bacterium]